MSLFKRGGSFVNSDQEFAVDFFCEDVVIHINRPIYAPYYRAIEKRSIATTPFAVER